MIDRIVVWALRLKEERGQDLVEYAVLTGTIAIGVIIAAGLFGAAVSGWFGALTTWFGSIGP
jgi:Flp pilus assembly pilin Flp